MTEYVFDTEPLIAFLYDELGHETVADLIGSVQTDEAAGTLDQVNASELFYKIARIEGSGAVTDASLRVADRDVRTLLRNGIDLARADWRLAGEIKAHGGMSLADAHAAALAHERDATLVVGADDDFESLPVDVTLERFRDQSV